MIRKYKQPRRIKQKRSIVRKIAKNGVFWVGVLVFLLMGGMTYGIFLSPLLRIERIEVRGNQKIAADILSQFIKERLSRNILFFRVSNLLLADFAKIKEDVERAFSPIESVSIKRQFLHSIVLEVHERKEEALWCQKKNYTVEISDSNEKKARNIQQCFALDRNGIIFEEKEGESRLVALFREGEKSVHIGAKVIAQELLEVLLRFQQKIDDFPLFEDIGLRVSSILLVSPDRANARISEGWEVYLDPKQDINWQITKLTLVLEREIPFEKRAKLEYIDLRFGDQAYIKYRSP
ncbi:MAG: cell division protein FtsQ/DivIB [Patescibacteria group bacterium]